MIDWNLLQPTNALGSYVNAYEAGKARGKERAIESALSKYDADPQGAAKEVMRLDPELGLRLQKESQAQADRERRKAYGAKFQSDPRAAVDEATAAGDYDVAAELDKMDDEKAAKTLEGTKTLAAIGTKLRGMPYEERLKALETLRPALIQRGLDPAQVNAFDPSDQNLDGLLLSVADLAAKIEPRILQSGRFAVGINPESGEEMFRTELPQDPLDREYREAQIARARRAPAGRGGGGGAQSKLPTGFILDGQ